MQYHYILFSHMLLDFILISLKAEIQYNYLSP
jgi:hypothetical protein